jgi:glycolate oxidase FAD binding subunit
VTLNIVKMSPSLTPTTVEELQEIVRSHERLHLRGGCTKSALSTPLDGTQALDVSGLSGIVEYDPGELTFTALGGTPVAEVRAQLDAHSQYLPFDPPFADSGATLGGTVASGLSGPGRYRFGGIRDFILGVSMVDGSGRLVCGGGKVVKNAAGFDIPKLVIGSLGEFGALVELTFKVFPKPESQLTIAYRCSTLDAALEALYRVYTSQLDMVSLDLEADVNGTATVWIRIGGLSESVRRRANRIRSMMGGGEIHEGTDEDQRWQDARDLVWSPPEWNLLKVPLSPRHVTRLESELKGKEALRRYSSGANVAWIATPESSTTWDGFLGSLGLPGLFFVGSLSQVRVGRRDARALEERIRKVFDPTGRFSRH